MSGATDQNPFVGPRSIQQGEALYGRDAEVRELYNRLQARRIVVLHSPSGAGKSSLVAAGLIPRLREGHYDVWKPIRLNLDPGGLAGLPEGVNRYLLSAMVSLEEELPEDRRRGPAELAQLDFRDYLETRPRRKERAAQPVVLLFDQFEEVLTVAPRAIEAKRELFAALGRALEKETCWALFILREDYLAALSPYRDRIPTQLSNTFRLDLLGLAGAREVAVKLAEQGGRDFPAVDRLIRDLSAVQVQQPDGSFETEQGQHIEPVQLQVVCRRLWEAMAAEDRSIDAEDIGAHTQVSASLAAYYADAVSKIAAGNQAVERVIREWIGQKLIVSGIRSQVQQEPESSAGLGNVAIRQLLDSYLVRADQRAGANWFELSHDRLVEPIQQDNQAWEQVNLHPMQVAARRWEGGKRASELLLDGHALAEAVRWAGANLELLTEGEREFLELSRVRRREESWNRHRWRIWVAGLAPMVVVGGAEGYRRWDLRQRIHACEAAGAEVEVAWSAQRRQALRNGILATGMSYAPATVEKVMPWLERQAAGWRTARIEACLDAKIRGSWDEEMLDRSLWCLSERRMQLESLVDQLTRPDQWMLQKAVTAASGLEPTDSCRNEGALKQLVLPPERDRERIGKVQAQLAKVGALLLAGRYGSSLETAREALGNAEKIGWKPLSASAKLRAGQALFRLDDLDAAERSLEEAYFEAGEGGVPEVAFDAALYLSRVVGSGLRRSADGLLWGRHAELSLAKIRDEANLRRAQLLYNLSEIHYRSETYDEAIKLGQRVLGIREQVLGPEHPDVAAALIGLANSLVAAGAAEEGKALLTRALGIVEQTMGPEHPGVAFTLSGLAKACQSLGELAEARAFYRRSLDLKEQIWGPENPMVADELNNIALYLLEIGAYDEAKATAERALALWEKTRGSEHLDVSFPLDHLGRVYTAKGKYEEAKTFFERALAIRDRVLGPDHYLLDEPLRGLAEISLKQQRPGDALDPARRALALAEQKRFNAWSIAEARFVLAQALWDTPPAEGGDRKQAMKLAREARESFRTAGKLKARRLAETEAWLADRKAHSLH